MAENKKYIGVIVADDGEYTPLKELILSKDGQALNGFFKEEHTLTLNQKVIYTVCCGIGKVNAAAAAMYLVNKGCQVLLNYGYSGGVSGIKRGEMMFANRFLEHDFDLTPLGYEICQKPGQEYIYSADEKLLSIANELYPFLAVGTAVCGDRFICDNQTRIFMKEKFNAMSCDMETAAIASVCHITNVGFLSLRKISDDAGDDAKESYRETISTTETAMSDIIFAIAEKIAF